MIGVTQRAFFDASLRDMDNALLTMRNASSRGSAFDVGNAGIRVALGSLPPAHYPRRSAMRCGKQSPTGVDTLLIMRQHARPCSTEPAGGSNNVEATDQLCGPRDRKRPGDAGGVRPLPPRGHATPGKPGDPRPCAGRVLVVCEFLARRVQAR